MYQGDVSLLEEIREQDMDGIAHGAATVSSFTPSGWLGNNGMFCTLTKECQPNCN